MTPTPDRLKRRLFVIAGTVALVIGVVGIIIPVMPDALFAACGNLLYKGWGGLWWAVQYNTQNF